MCGEEAHYHDRPPTQHPSTILSRNRPWEGQLCHLEALVDNNGAVGVELDAGLAPQELGRRDDAWANTCP